MCVDVPQTACLSRGTPTDDERTGPRVVVGSRNLALHAATYSVQTELDSANMRFPCLHVAQLQCRDSHRDTCRYMEIYIYCRTFIEAKKYDLVCQRIVFDMHIRVCVYI